MSFSQSLVNVRRHTVAFDPDAKVVYTVRRSANLFGNANAQNIGGGQNMTRKGSIVDATKKNNANNAENSSDKIGSKSVVQTKKMLLRMAKTRVNKIAISEK